MRNHKHIKCYCDLHEMMRNGCPSARGLPCPSAPASKPVDNKTPEFCKSCLASADDTLFCNKAITGGLCEECLVSKIENGGVAMSALRWLVDEGYTEDEVMFAYRRFLELHKKP
jgi:hypothetical protein